MAVYKNAYELAEKRKGSNGLATALVSPTLEGGTQNNNYNSNGLGSSLSELGKSFGKYLATKGSDTTNSVPSQYQFANLGKPLFGDYDLGGSNAGLGSFNSFLKNTDTASSTGSSLLGNIGTYAPLISGGISAGSEAINGGSWRDDVPQAFFGIDNKKDSDVMQALKGAGKGAMMGAPFGPVGMIAGAVLGLGSSFLDDI